MEYSGMSRIITISSWPSSKTTWRTSEGSSRSPLVISSYIRATRTGVSRMPGRPRSSPMPSSSRRTPRSTFSKSKLFGSSIPPQTASAPCYVHGADAWRSLWEAQSEGKLVSEVTAEEDVLLLGAEHQRSEPVAHAVLADHLAGELGRLLDVVGGAGGRVQEPQLL